MKYNDLTKDELIYLLEKNPFSPRGEELERSIYFYRYMQNSERRETAFDKSVETNKKRIRIHEIFKIEKETNLEKASFDLLSKLTKLDKESEKLDRDIKRYERERDKYYKLYLKAGGI